MVYKVDRLTRSLADFAKLVELFDGHGVSFVSVTQQFNTTTSMGRLTLNVLLSFAQFEREVTSERIRDKIAASKRKGLWVGGIVPLGYATRDRKIVVVAEEAERGCKDTRPIDAALKQRATTRTRRSQWASQDYPSVLQDDRLRERGAFAFFRYKFPADDDYTITRSERSQAQST